MYLKPAFKTDFLITKKLLEFVDACCEFTKNIIL
jgi:hypothetical protein